MGDEAALPSRRVFSSPPPRRWQSSRIAGSSRPSRARSLLQAAGGGARRQAQARPSAREQRPGDHERMRQEDADVYRSCAASAAAADYPSPHSPRASRRRRPGPRRLPRSAAWPNASGRGAHRRRHRRPCRRMSSPSPAALFPPAHPARSPATAPPPWRRRFQLGERHHLVHEADAARLLGAEALAGQRIAAHLADADGVAELRDDDRRRQPPAHLRDREQRIVGGDHHVAGGDDAGAAAEAAALHQRHRRHRQPVRAAAPPRRSRAKPPRSPQAIAAARR